jgi:hypothetical protein
MSQSRTQPGSRSASASLTLSGEPLPPPLALASRILFDGLFDRLDHETLGHGHNFVSRAASARCAVRLLVDAAAGLEQLRSGWAGRDDELTPGILEASMLRLFPFFTADHMAAVRRYAVGGGSLPSPAAAASGWPFGPSSCGTAPTSPLRPSRYAMHEASASCSATDPAASFGFAVAAPPGPHRADTPRSGSCREPSQARPSAASWKDAEPEGRRHPPDCPRPRRGSTAQRSPKGEGQFASATARAERSLLSEPRTEPARRIAHPGRALTEADVPGCCFAPEDLPASSASGSEACPASFASGSEALPSTMLPPLRPTETPARALGLRLPRTQFVEVGSPAQDPGLALASPFSPTRRARPPPPAPRYMTDETGVVRWRSGAVVHSRMVACPERVVVLGPEGGSSHDPPSPLARQISHPPSPLARQISHHRRPLYVARFEVPHRLFLIHARPSAASFRASACGSGGLLYESYLELWPGLVGMPPRPELVGFRCEDARARFVLVATEPSQGVSRRIELVPRDGVQPVWEVPEPGGVLDMRRFARLVLVVEVPGPETAAADPGDDAAGRQAASYGAAPLPEMWVHVCALGRLACVE